jgi:SAM-dependent methyltransferase
MARKSIRNLLIYKFHDQALERAASQYLKGKMLDIGCGIKPYADMMRPFVTEHIGVDYEGSLHSKDNVDLLGTAYNIPAPDASFDSAICTSVLEHLEEPEQALRECYRVLKSGGVAIYSVPFIWHLHEEPRDFYRFSKYGLDYLFTKVGFEIIEINALSGFWGTFGQMLVYYIYRFNRGPLRWFKIIDATALLIQGLAFVLDRFDRAEQWASLYLLVARKK